MNAVTTSKGVLNIQVFTLVPQSLTASWTRQLLKRFCILTLISSAGESVKSINNIVLQIIGYHFQCFGFFPFLKIHILYYFLLPEAVLPYVHKHAFWRLSSLILFMHRYVIKSLQQIQDFLLHHHLHEVYIYSFLTPTSSTDFNFKMSWNQTWLYYRSEIINTAKETSHSAFSVFNSCQLLATTYLHGMSCPLPVPWILTPWSIFRYCSSSFKEFIYIFFPWLLTSQSFEFIFWKSQHALWFNQIHEAMPLFVIFLLCVA